MTIGISRPPRILRAISKATRRRSRTPRIAMSASRCRGATCRRKSQVPPSSMTWCGRTCCTRASCASHVAARSLASLDEAALRRAERGDFRIVRVGNFVAFVGADETVVQRAAAVAPLHAKWDNVRQIAPEQQEAAWLVGQPCDDRVHGRSAAGGETVGTVVSASYSRPYVAHASMAPSCALAEYRGGHLSVWSHTQGVYPLRTALANVLGIAAGHDHRASCAWRRLLRAQRRGRCRGGCCGDRDADPRSLHPRAMAPRGGVRLRAGRFGDARHAARRAGRCGKTRGLDCGNLVGRRMCSGRAAAATC